MAVGLKIFELRVVVVCPLVPGPTSWEMASASQDMPWHSNSFTKKTRRGKVLRVVKEHYLRDDLTVPCELQSAPPPTSLPSGDDLCDDGTGFSTLSQRVFAACCPGNVDCSPLPDVCSNMIILIISCSFKCTSNWMDF